MASARVYTEQVAVKTECVGETPLTGARKYDQATPVLNVMPWLPVCRRIDILAQNNSNVPFQNFLPPLPFFRSGVPGDRKTWGECVRDDMKLLGLQPEWAVFRDMWRDLIWSKRLTLP